MKRGRKGVEKKISKTKVIKKQKKEEKIEKEIKMPKFSSIRTRTSPKPLYKVLKGLNKEQKAIVEKMGFGKLLNMDLEGVTAKLRFYVVDNFDEKKMELSLEKGKIKITKDLIYDMLGIPKGEIQLFEIESKKDKRKDAWRKKYPKNLSAQKCVQSIVDGHSKGWEFILDFLTVFAFSFGDSFINGWCKLDFLPHVHRKLSFKDVDWCGFVYFLLKKNKET